jgi:peptidyl-prolyl cis-trans isomerase D
MLISKFNKIIRNRMVWGVLIGLMGISMIAYFGGAHSIFDYISMQSGCSRSNHPVVNPDTVAMLDEKPVTEAEFRQARADTYLSLCFLVGQKIALNDRVEKELRRRTWERIAALRQARALSIETGDDEVLAAITRDEKFMSEAGAFQPDRYQAFAQSILPQFGATKTDYERMVRDDVTLQKLQNTIGSSAWVAPYELDRAMSTYADTFTIKYVTLPESLVADTVKPDRKAIEAYFEKNTNLFEIPPKVQVSYVIFDNPPETAFTNAITDEEIEQYYDDNRKAYRIESTNEADSAKNSKSETNQSESVENLRPLEEVRDEIRLTLAAAAAHESALTRARDFSYALTPDRDGHAPTFNALAAEPLWKVPVQTSDWFSLREPVAGIPDSMAFKRAAFELEPDSEEAYSDGISGSNAAYVVHLLSRQEARVPSFDEVEAKVRPVALKELQQEALRKKAESLRKEFLAALKAGKSFDNLAADQRLGVSTTKPFSSFTAPEELSDTPKLNEITSRSAGDITEPMFSTNGLMLAYIDQRVPALDEAKQAVYRQVLTSLARQRAKMVYNEWEQSLTATNRLREFNQQINESSSEDEAPEPGDAPGTHEL